MAITNHTTPTTANGMACFFPTATFTVGTTIAQNMPAAAICGRTNTLLTVHPNMRTTMIIPKFFFNNVISIRIKIFQV